MLRKETIEILKRWIRWQRLGFVLMMFLVVHTISGCSSSSSKQLYEDGEFGIRLEVPRNWSLESYERNGSIVLESKGGLFEKDSARVEVYGIACVPFSIDAQEQMEANVTLPIEALEANIKRIQSLYGLDSVTILQSPNKVESEDYQIYTTKIQIPTMSMSEDSPRNQVGVKNSNTLQTIELYLINDESNNGIWVEVYTGNDEQLNVQAEDIVDSIELTCPTEP